MSIFTSLLAIVATAQLIPRDVEERTIYTILAKPVPRYEYLIGKLGGVLLLLALSLLAMSALFLALLFVRQEMLVGETLRQTAGLRPAQVRTRCAVSRPPPSPPTFFPGIVRDLSEGRAARLPHPFRLDLRDLEYLHDLRDGLRLLHRPSSGDGARVLAAGNTAPVGSRKLFSLSSRSFFPISSSLIWSTISSPGTAIPVALFAQTAVLGCVYTSVYLLLRLGRFSREENYDPRRFVAFLVLAFGALRVPIESSLSTANIAALISTRRNLDLDSPRANWTARFSRGL